MCVLDIIMIIRLVHYINILSTNGDVMKWCNHHISIIIISKNKSRYYNCWEVLPQAIIFILTYLRLKRINNDFAKDANNVFVDPS